jgi:hypothetical protein
MPRGLDFTMRNKTFGISSVGSHGYAVTPEKAFDQIMSNLNIEPVDNFIDIGSGKGGCLSYASKYNFGKIAGIEVEEFLHLIAVKNLKILKLDKRIDLYLEDALKFDKFQDYNIFYLFNPFSFDIYRQVLDRIFGSLVDSSRLNKNVVLICYGDSDYEYIKQSNIFKLEYEGFDNIRDSRIHVWKIKD